MGHACFSTIFPHFACRFSLEKGPKSYIGIMEQAREEIYAKFDAKFWILPLAEQKIGFFASFPSLSAFVLFDKVVEHPIPLRIDYSYAQFHGENKTLCLFI